MKRFFKPIEKNGNQLAPSTSNTVVQAKQNVKETVEIPAEEPNSDSSDSNASTLAMVPKKMKYIQKYKPEWENKFCWLKNVNGQAFCKLCKKTMVNNLAHIKRHDGTSTKHKQNLISSKEMQQLDVSFLGQQSMKKKQVEIMCVLYCVQHCLPFRIMESLPKLIQTISPQSIQAQQIKCGRTKSTEYINTVIGPFAAEKISQILRAQQFSVIIDETTDVTSEKCLVLICRYFDLNRGKIIDIFFGLIKLESSTASDIFGAIKEHFFKFNVDLRNIIGLATDNASVMAGNFQSVKAKFRDVKSDMFFLGCTCHSIALCVNHALKHFPDTIEKTIKNTYNHFSHSAKRLNDFSVFQADFNLKNHKILRLCKTRWLSLEAVVQRILEQWEALKHYFVLYCFEVKESKDPNAHEIVEFLNFTNGGFQRNSNSHNSLVGATTMHPLSSIVHPKWNEPYFDLMMPANVTALVGKSAYLSCRVKNLGNKTVSWIRHRDLHILTVVTYTYSTDQRFQTTHHKDTDEWTLHIKWAQLRDAGVYECQVSTIPIKSFSVHLNVVVPTTTILGGPDMYVDKGSTINLTCAVKYSPEPPAYIFWYHEDDVISDESLRGGIIIMTDNYDPTISYLLIHNADLADTGKYTCDPSNAHANSIKVHVLNGERPEAMQTSDGIKKKFYFIYIILFIIFNLVFNYFNNQQHFSYNNNNCYYYFNQKHHQHQLLLQQQYKYHLEEQHSKLQSCIYQR